MPCDAAFHAVGIIALGVFALTANKNITLGGSFIVSAVTAVVLMRRILRSYDGLYPYNAKRRFRIGVGWGRGVNDTGLLPWILALPVVSGVISALTLLMHV